MSKGTRDMTAVAMSGGLDSSVTAWLLAGQGESVIGLSMLLWDRSAERTHGRCCGALDLGDAKRVAQQCGIPHYTLRMDREFMNQVVDPFVQDYLDGRTPSPCIRCNTWVKFDLFLERARQLGATRMATGHYARILASGDGWELHKALDESKDQSYFLFELTQEQLAATRFPLGEMSKERVRDLAREADLVVCEKPESMEICFVSAGIREFVEGRVRQFPERYSQQPEPRPSTIVDSAGRQLGEGEPYYRYTVGQRRGLGVASSERLYVLGVEPRENRIVVGGERQLATAGFVGERVHWIGPAIATSGEATVKIRSRHPGVRSEIRQLPDGRVEVEFGAPQAGVTPGQAAVFYQGTRVLGGCWIQRQTDSSERLSTPA
jgi:tRNA-specific 2-thiouridylase